MLKNILKIMPVLMMLVFVLMTTCYKSDPPEPPGKTSDFMEFMYRRVKPIINPEWNDPDCFMIRLKSGGGMNLDLTLTGDNEWRAEESLDYNNSQNPYYIWTDDGKVARDWASGAVAMDIFARIKDQQEWIKLALVESNGSIPGGEWAVFCIDKNGIYSPE